MIPAEPTQRTRRRRRVVAADLDVPRPQSPPEPARGLAESAHPVVDDADGYTLACPGDQRFAEVLADRVVVNDVAFEVDESGRAGDRIEPRWIVLARVLQQANAVARHERCAGGSRECLLGERAHRDEGFAPASAHGVHQLRSQSGSGTNSTSSPRTLGNRPSFQFISSRKVKGPTRSRARAAITFAITGTALALEQRGSIAGRTLMRRKRWRVYIFRWRPAVDLNPRRSIS